MAYEKQGFHSGEKLKASQLSAMEDGIIEAEKLAMEGAAGAANMEKGTGENATQQLAHLEKMTTKDGVVGFDTGSKNGYVNNFYPYGATGPYSATLNGRSSAQGEYSLSANSQTAAPGNYATSLGYATVAGGDCSLAGGSGTYAAAEGAVSLGMKTKADAAYAISTGSNTQALADCSITGGVETVAKGEYSVSLGKGNVASYAGQTVIGIYNKLDENNEAIKTILTIGSGINHENYGVLRDDALRILDNRAILFFPLKGSEQDVNVEPICLQDVVTIVGQELENLYQTTSNLSSTDSGLQIQISDLQSDIRHISNIVTNLQARVAALESK